MQFSKLSIAVCAVAVSLAAGQALAKVSPEEASKLGGSELTPMGSTRAGNADGTIPEWTGGITEPPAGYQEGEYHRSPFPDDKVNFMITHENLDQHKDKMLLGQLAMFEKYSEFKMPVYQTRRTAAFPQWVYDAYKYNAEHAEIIAIPEQPNGYSPKNSIITSPFPIPNEGDMKGRQIILNHLFRFLGQGYREFYNQLVTTEDGEYIVSQILYEAIYPYSKQGVSPEEITKKNTYSMLFQEAQAPARIAGGVIIGNSQITPFFTNAWSYNPGQRRVRRAPQIAYDNPGTGTDGLRFTDQLWGYLGSIDRYDWSVDDKREAYVPYNNYVLHSDKITYDDIIRKGHINQDLNRYELHRVWPVQATVHPGTMHSFVKRTFFLDEDNWGVVAADNYDKRGNLWRYQETMNINYYEIPMVAVTMEIIYDLQSGRYIVIGADNEQGYAPNRKWTTSEGYFNPARLKGSAKR